MEDRYLGKRHQRLALRPDVPDHEPGHRRDRRRKVGRSNRCAAMTTKQILAAATLAGAMVGALGSETEDKTVVQPPPPRSLHLGMEGEFPSLAGATEWINSPPLTPAGLRGKVVVVDFWTLTCVNWLRTLPYVRAWAAKYKDQGLVVIGVHSPEFSFEKNPNNVRWAVKDLRVDYPVAMDSEHVIWRAFNNQYWPALYFIDAQGRMRHYHFGEGAYEQSEMVIQRLLADAGAGGIGDDLVPVDPRGLEVAADWGSLKSPENY